MALITTLIPTYRRPALLKRAISSVLRQSYSDVQVCVFDNASGDETGDVVREIIRKDPRVRYFCNDANIGAYNNFITALQQVDTKYFSFLSDDDVLTPNFYLDAVAAFNKCPGVAYVVAKTVFFGDMGRFVTVRPKRLGEGLFEPPKGFESMVLQGMPCWTGMLFDSEKAFSVGPLDPKAGLWCDYEYILRIASKYPFFVIDSIGALYSSPSYKEGSKGDLLIMPEGYVYLYNKISRDYELPKKQAVIASDKLADRYLTRLKKAMIGWIANSDQESLRKAVNILKMHGCHISHYWYSFIVYVSNHFSLVKWLFETYRKGRIRRKEKRKIKKESCQNLEVESALQYLKELSSDCGLTDEECDTYYCRRNGANCQYF